MKAYEKKLENGEIKCRLWHKEELKKEFFPSDTGQLYISIDIGGYDYAQGNFIEELIDFIESGEKHAVYKAIAWKNYYKFGDLFHQHKEEYLVEFEDMSVV